MRHVIVGVVAVLLLVAAPVLAADGKAELQKQLNDVTKQIRDLEQKTVKENADIKKLADAVTDSQKALDKAYGEIPDIKAVDEKITAVRKEMNDLQKQRMEAMKKAGDVEAVKTARKALTDAQDAVKKDPTSADAKKALADAQAAYMKALSEVPEVKAVDDKMTEPRKRLNDLMKERNELVKKNIDNEGVKKPTQAVLDAKAPLEKSLAGVEGMKDLVDKKAELEKQLKAAPAKEPKKNGGPPPNVRPGAGGQ